MAGDPAPLAAVQAAVMKSSAAAQGQTEPAPTGGAFQGAIAQDLAVMADQAKGYSAGAAAGNVEAENQRGAASSRMALEASQAAAARQRQIQMAQMDTNQARLRLAQQQQEGQIRLRDQAREAEERRRVAVEAERGSPEDRQAERAAEIQRQILLKAVTNEGPAFAGELSGLLADATTYREFAALYDAYAADPEYTVAQNAPDRAKALEYAKVFFDAGAGKKVRVSKLDAAREAARRSNVAQPAPAPKEDSGGGILNGFTRSLRSLGL